MAEDTKEDTKVKEAETFTPAQEESSAVAERFLAELFDRAKMDDRNKPTTDGGTPKPGYDFHQGKGENAARDLQDLFIKTGADGKAAVLSDKAESYDKNNVRVLQDGDKKTFQQVAKDGTTTTRLNDNTSVEYDQKTGKYTQIDGKPPNQTRTELSPDSDKPIVPGGKSLKEMVKDGFSTEKSEDGKSDKTTYLDGTVKTTFKEGPLESRTTYPPGHKGADGKPDGLRQEERFRGEGAGDKTENSARTVKHYEDRKETSFDNGNISKVTAYKNPDSTHPAVSTEYRDNKGPDGASKIDTYKDDGNPKHVKSVTEYKDGQGKELKPDMIQYNNGQKAERPANGDLRTPIGQGDRTGVVDVDKETGMPTHMKIGDRDYKLSYGPDGKVKSMTVESKNPPGNLQMERGEDGKLKVTKADGAFAPDKDGKINLEGLPVQTKLGADGKTEVVGDVHANKNGDMRYKTGDGPDRKEMVRRADGSKEEYDYKAWTKTTTSADGKTQKQQAWDGYGWRDFKPSADGKRLEFGPMNPPDPKRPSYIERSTDGTPPGDKTVIGYADGSKTDCDWQKGVQTSTDKAGKQTTRYYDGATYREGTELDASKVADPATGKPPLGDPSKGDRVIQFKDPKVGEPSMALRRADGSMKAIYPPENAGQKPTTVEKNAQGQVTEVNGPKGRTQFKYDGDGDVNQITELDEAGKVKQTTTRVGQEQNTGMQQWLGREGKDTPRQPDDKSPRDPYKPSGYNTWSVTGPDGKPVGDGKPVVMNVNTTADGTIRTEKPPTEAGKPGEVFMRTPRGDNYIDTATSRITDRGQGIKETLDKKSGERTLEVDRNGLKTTLNYKDGPINVLKDGSVVQTNNERTQGKMITPDGSIAQFKNENGKQVITDFKMADPAKPGEFQTFTPGTPPVKSVESVDGRFKVVTTGSDGKDTSTVYDLKEGSKSVQQPGENFGRAVSMKDGKYLGISNPDGAPVMRLDKDGNAKLFPTGQIISAKDYKFGPNDITKGADGNAVIKSAKEGSTDQYLLKPNGAFVETKDGKDKTTFPNKMEATFKPDGTVDTVSMGNPSKQYEPILEGGKIVGLKAKDGSGKIDALPPGTKYENKLNENGAFVSESTDDKGTKTRTEWAASEGKYSFEQSWKTADGKDAKLNYIADKEGNVTHFTLPPGPPERGMVKVAEARNNEAYKDLSAKVDKDGNLQIDVNATTKIKVSKDGTVDEVRKDPATGAETVNRRNRDGNLVPTDKQAEDLGKLLDLDLSKPENQQKLVQDLLSRFTGPNALKDAESFLKSLNEKLAAAGKGQIDLKMIDNKRNLVVTKGGAETKIPLG